MGLMMIDNIPERIERQLVLHQLRILNEHISGSPLILGISGPSGEGKTFQCKSVLKKLGVRVFEMSAGQFESKDAGEPAELLRKKYVKACKYVNSGTNKSAAILIDDVDVAIGNWGSNTQYTVNTQNVIGELMHLADPYAKLVEDGKTYSERIPIYMTGNDFSKIYSPLKRNGRMEVYYWKPTSVEKIGIVSNLLSFLSYEDSRKLVEYVNSICSLFNLVEAPIAFYSELKSHLNDEILWQQYTEYKKNNYSLNNVFSDLCTTGESVSLTYNDVRRIAYDKLIDMYNSNQNHLSEAILERNGLLIKCVVKSHPKSQ